MLSVYRQQSYFYIAVFSRFKRVRVKSHTVLHFIIIPQIAYVITK